MEQQQRRTWLDRAINWVSPRWGMQRARARAAGNVYLSYEGARIDRRMYNWWTTNSSANAEIGPALPRLRDRSRDLVRNNAYAARAIDELVGHAVGTGITAQVRTSDALKSEKVKQQINDAWKIWVDECDADGQLDFYGLQRLVAREVYEAGECLIRFRTRYMEDGFHVPFQLQVLEGDFLDHNRTQVTKTGRIIQGVEFDLLGRRVAYWLFPEHPGEILINYFTNTMISERVPAEYVLHVYRKERQQVRGVPILAPVIISLRDLDEYAEAELVRKKIEACFGAFVTQPDADQGPTLGKLHVHDHQEVETMEPGMIKYLRPGEEVSFGSPSGAGAGFRDFMRDYQTRIASGVGLTYEQLTGDLSNVNYSSYRAGLLSFRNNIDTFRWLTFKPMFCDPIRREFIKYAFGAGRISQPYYPTDWAMPGYGSVDPVKDAEAMLARVRMGVETWKQAVGEEGYDPEEQLESIKQQNEEWDKAGIVLDCDPRQRSKNGGEVKKAEPQSEVHPPAEPKQAQKINGKMLHP